MIDSIINRTYLRSMFLLCSLYLLLERWSFRVIKACFSKFSTSSICAFLLLLCLGLFSSGNVLAQEEPGEENIKWKGIDVTTVLNHSEYAKNGKEIYLYNVGTGRFIIEGGNWGMEGRLFHEDFGRPMSLMKDGFIKSGITEKSDEKSWFGCNASGAFHPNSWSDWNKYSYTIMMDARKSYRNGWVFERVEDSSNTTTYTYYMYETSTQNGYRNNKYYLGAAYGDCWAVDASGNPAWKGNGQLLPMDDDRATWTITDPRHVQTEYLVNDKMVTLDELYQWRVVSKEQFYALLEEEVTGLNPSVSALIPDRDFARNSDNFDTYWVTEENDDAVYSGIGRWGYTFGVYTGKTLQNNSTFPTEAWNKPLRLKNVFEGDLPYGWKNAKYGFLTFEGVGRTYTEFKVSHPGWYMVQCYGFIQSDNNEAYIFARVVDRTNNPNTVVGESKNNLVKVPSDTYHNKNKKDSCLVVGNHLTIPGDKKESYKNTVWIFVPSNLFPDDETHSSNVVLQIGVGKDAATRSSNSKKDQDTNTDCYYDTDWVCVDDFRASYLGLGPCFFYEDEEDLEYLRFDEHNIKQFQSAAPDNHYGGAVCLERTLNKNKWNSFSFPLKLTGEQMRSAFGEDAQLAKINSVGNLSQNPNVIDFETVSLFTTKTVVEPGHFYLLKPTKEPTEGKDPKGRDAKYYELGRMFFSVNEEDESYTHDKMSLDTLKVAKQTISSLENAHNGIAHVNYVQTPDYENIMELEKTKEYYVGAEHGIYAETGAYVVSSNTIFHINKNTPLKGFRGWIVLEHPINDVTMSVHSRVDGGHEDTSVESLPMVVTQLSADTEVYDLCGRKVGALGSNLPKGIYLVNGRKYFVK